MALPLKGDPQTSNVNVLHRVPLTWRAKPQCHRAARSPAMLGRQECAPPRETSGASGADAQSWLAATRLRHGCGAR